MVRATFGKCEMCGMKGVLVSKAVVLPTKGDDVAGDKFDPDSPAELPILKVCQTCANTPPGCVSENVSHKRLPKEEYQ